MSAAPASSSRRAAARADGRGVRWPSKQPGERLDFAIDWTERLEGDAIAASQFAVPPGILGEASSRSATSTTIWLSAGVDRRSYLIVNSITTAAGRVMRQAVMIKVRAKSRA
ncbi:hypothetical protein IVA87_33925 [Bradyrhizobium sp. 147]|uniref:phage fiber-tail adaptor protein n=1 Tax=Bradyrhizobium sp. 147 TaxID=2782623 RepID=UPI001FF930FF|nr:hypothetical protein [Bradyrhizobium sp. 147]MCK1684253.1 hypothetical protein [Bradyrhizobium sp. 147]